MASSTTDPVCAVFMGLHNFNGMKEYPAWRYHKVLQPILVNDTSEDVEAKKKEFEEINTPLTANLHLVNWVWDIEDMSPRQLVCFAKEEYGIDLPVDAGQESLQRAILELGKCAPQNRGRMVLMAHTINMNYDQTLAEIKRLAENGMTEIETKVIEI